MTEVSVGWHTAFLQKQRALADMALRYAISRRTSGYDRIALEQQVRAAGATLDSILGKAAPNPVAIRAEERSLNVLPVNPNPAGERIADEPAETLEFLVLQSIGLRSTAEANRLKCEIAIAAMRRVAESCFTGRATGNDEGIRNVLDPSRPRMEPHHGSVGLKGEAQKRVMDFQAACKRMAATVEQARQNLNAALNCSRSSFL